MNKIVLFRNATEMVIGVILLFTSFIRNLDGFMYIIIILFMIVLSGLCIFALFKYKSIEELLTYQICSYGIIVCDLINLVVAMFFSLLVCYIIYTITMAAKAVGLFFLLRSSDIGATSEGGTSKPEEMADNSDKRETPIV